MFKLAALLLLAAGTAQAAQKAVPVSGVCSTFSEATVRTLTGVPTGAFSRRALYPAPVPGGTVQRCDYGVYQGDLVLDIYHFATDTAAIAQMARLGSVTNSVNNTASSYGTDQVNEWHKILSETDDEEVFDLTGYAARHGSTIVALGLNRPGSDFSKDGIQRLQATALTTAGAQLAPWPKEDVCARVPARAIQTLVTLGPATILTTEQKSSGGNSTCEYEVHPFDSDDPVAMRVVLTASRWINDREALDGMHAKSTASPSFRTADSADLILQVDSRADTAYALHAGDAGKVYVSGAEDAARNQPSYQVHLEQAALLAAGASVLPGPAVDSIPKPVDATPFRAAKRDVTHFLADYWVVLLIVLVIAYFIWRARRRHELILHGLPGTARVNSVSDTGVTINNDPMIRLHVTVTPQNGMPYDATVSQTVSRLEAPASWVGRLVQVRIDPKKPQRFVIL